MDRIAIVGGAPLVGSIPISGAKNSAIKLMAASLLTDQPLRLTNMPRLADTRFLGRLLERLGVRVVEMDGPAEAETILENAAREPELEDLADCLNAMGAKVEGAGTSTIRITGVAKLHGAT